jgi:NADPH-dependent 2,4-dienoyl-CoA reductase/sulfur reductase-like enzyme
MKASPRIVIVGAGPAGVRAAQALAECGVRPIVIDEGQRDGGQIYRRQPAGFTRPYAKLYGTEAAKAQSLHESFDALRERIDYRPETLVWNVTDGAVHAVREGQTVTLPYDALLVCSGATDRLMPIPGWQRAGCYSLGAAQIALKAQACAIGARTVFIGSGPLLYLVATQYLQAGAKVAAVLDTSPATKPWAALRGLLARPALAWRGLRMISRLRRSGVPLLQGVQPIAIDGDEARGATAVRVRDAQGREHRFETDAVALGWHLRAETQLADLARCEFVFEPQSRQWLPRIDAEGRSSVPHVYVAGDGARILGADGAEAAGRLAALAALADLGHAEGQRRHAAEAEPLRRTLERMDRFRAGLVAAFPWPHAQAAALPDDTIVCRCECISAGELRACVRDKGSREVNRAKAFGRVGMGRCQGRYCGHAGAEIVAAAAGVPVEMVGRLRTQAPVKPLLMAAREAEQA